MKRGASTRWLTAQRSEREAAVEADRHALAAGACANRRRSDDPREHTCDDRRRDRPVR